MVHRLLLQGHDLDLGGCGTQAASGGEGQLHLQHLGISLSVGGVCMGVSVHLMETFGPSAVFYFEDVKHANSLNE